MMKKGLYKYKRELYVVTGEIKSKNSITREWEKHIIYICINIGQLYSREKKDFEKRFEYVSGRLDNA